ncbi:MULTISPECIES: hypothetical protein [Pseudobutyrivibrio]|uniref:Uncharacterized protein n=1 Tax=Pseudobutyrivibrio xylanivorans TaxID=185007 RepID=A0A1G5S2R3_PSEXY|nr:MULTISPECIES: hypothetical protein [Pseudobutyrivibrio]MDC7279189.1 hypothetical protein [Butyrivibrio fibrisolvens]SCZ80586.1 hypothetical protein SAMN02910350_02368 [Pseudobutyrivibrio xylanivorans]
MNQKEEMYDKFFDIQEKVHLENQKKIRVGLKVNIFLPLVFLLISFISNRSKLVFLLLWIISLFGISFYLLYIEYMDFKLQARLKEFGIIDEDENKALIGHEVVQGLDDINAVRKEVVQDIKDKKKEIKNEIRKEKEEIRKEKKELQEGIKKDIQTVGDKLKK